MMLVAEPGREDDACARADALEGEARDLATSGRIGAATLKFVTVSEICGPCLKRSGGVCRQKG